MNKVKKEINHKFDIGDPVFIIDEYTIVSCIVLEVQASLSYKSGVSSPKELINTSNTIYKLVRIQSYSKDGKRLFTRYNESNYLYDYHCSKVYGNVDDLISDLRSTIKK